MNPSHEYYCFNCGAVYSFQERVGLRDSCPNCDADLHSCRNCRHHCPSAHNQCNEPQAEWVREKDRANHCDYFEPQRGARGSASSPAQDARSRFEDLFKK